MDPTNPHHYLGLHEEGTVIRLLQPGALEVLGEAVTAETNVYRAPQSLTCKDYRIIHPSGLVAHDPYAFLPTFSEEDEQAFQRGDHTALDEVMGGRLCTHQEIAGVKFSVWAPCAKRVSLVGDFNNWEVEKNPMRRMGASGVWELFVPGLEEGALYKFAVFKTDGEVLFKADPYGYQGEMRPHTASVVTRIDRHEWGDQEWMENRKRCPHQPLNIYELHLGAWKKGYREVAPELSAYVKKMGYTHVELMPVMGHPLDESWGYQVSGFYAISRRYGTVEDFQYLVDHLHQEGIGVILDWVPGHFPIDDHSIARFDGTFLYEHQDPCQRYHPQWNTHIFNFGRHEVANFLIGSALFYLGKMHVDGLRVDAVSSIVYLDFERKEGEWLPNVHGGRENLEGIAFLKQLNQKVHDRFPTALMIAEESHAFPGVTDPEGLGFDLRWNLGWMNDTLRYFGTRYASRAEMQESLIHEMSYFYAEKHLLPLSHDEVVHGKKSLLSKSVGNEWEKFAHLRLLLSYMICHPGKKLLFMGGEMGQWLEWDCKEGLHWELLGQSYHHKLHRCVADLNHFYRGHPALYADDFSEEGFEWIDHSDHANGVLAYLRRGGEETLLCVHHFSPEELENYLIPFEGKPREIFSTDLKEYGGYGIMNPDITYEKEGIRFTLPPLATLILQV
ncbi:1,4-alpha-glucan branching protein GlgB [Candidatus Neptunochlamydia vexilliferae]|uniref:1,4-alpha-glucan branching enzyme GlgB n=1 Tax=Candidatus Neptunichlamydia vexilliferae TaxID=1651774 RepID=A0ABS0AWN4_9BACT|nr:1,4-alpha-glucan branching protein GlgB [Candidatus Neptunochlamydia vexilliferae]MBF5058549.1 1,4-alpha-glucan branching enzyme GlgB [Candidatus Neptunochlamydia vexilliferae]